MATLKIDEVVSLPEAEVEITAIRAQGAGGQHVNKTASAVHLRFDVAASSLPESYKQRLLAMQDQRLSKSGAIVIKAQQYREFDRNREDALLRLAALIRAATAVTKRRRATRPSRGARQRRTDDKTHRGQQKLLRRKIRDD